VDPCREAGRPCGEGEMCRVSACCRGVGFCVSAEAPVCAGFVGKGCRDPLVCLADYCVGDGDGRCVDAETAEALEAQHPGCWDNK
jgi:hypothetical protein